MNNILYIVDDIAFIMNFIISYADKEILSILILLHTAINALMHNTMYLLYNIYVFRIIPTKYATLYSNNVSLYKP